MSSEPSLEIVTADLERNSHRQALIGLLDAYLSDPMGLGRPLDNDHDQRLIPGLQACPTVAIFLAFFAQQPVGLAICFYGFSTFAARPLLNIHDFVIHPQYRGQGFGSQLLSYIEHQARRHGCCKTTLEVRPDNQIARSLYRKHGFGPGDPPYAFWTKSLETA